MDPGTRLGHYEILGQLGVGGMGEVYRARDTRLGREIALKVLPRGLAADPVRLRRFEGEARAIAALDHPNIVTIHSVEQVDGVHFLTMELVRGRTLAEMSDDGALTLPVFIEIAAQLADALAAAHERGIVHRDLKPANVMVTDGGRVKVLDFGLAKRSAVDAEDSETEVLTRDGMVLGTAPYMSPEQVQGRPLDHRSDIFSLGVIFYELLAGERPFRGENLAALTSSILRDSPPPVTEADPRVPPELGDLIGRCLAKDLGGRVQTARELVGALARLRDQVTGAVDEVRGDTANAVVVLPFANRSGDPDNEYFSDGLTEEVIADLSRVSSLRTISRNSAMALKGTTRDSRTLARELSVSHLVTGSVRRAGNALRVTAELVEAATDTPIWSEKYSGTVEDVFGIQEEIARKIVSALQVQLSDSEERRVAARPIDDVDAYDYYLRARQEMLRWTPDGLQRASKLVAEALVITGDNPLLLATEGQIAWTEVNILLEPPESGLRKAEALAKRALDLDPDAALGLFVRGLVAGLRGQVERALSDIRLAWQLDPSDANVLTELCRFCNSAGLRGQGVLVEHLTRIDPLSQMAPFVASTYCSCYGRFAEGAAAARRAIQLAPAISALHILAAWQIAESGARDEAVGILDQVAESLDGTVAGGWARFLAAALRGDQDEAKRALTPEVEASMRTDHWSRTIAGAYGALGLRDDAVRWVGKAVGNGFINYPCWTEYDPFLGEVRKEPAFEQLMAALKPRWEAVVGWEASLPAWLDASSGS